MTVPNKYLIYTALKNAEGQTLSPEVFDRYFGTDPNDIVFDDVRVDPQDNTRFIGDMGSLSNNFFADDQTWIPVEIWKSQQFVQLTDTDAVYASTEQGIYESATTRDCFLVIENAEETEANLITLFQTLLGYDFDAGELTYTAITGGDEFGNVGVFTLNGPAIIGTVTVHPIGAVAKKVFSNVDLGQLVYPE